MGGGEFKIQHSTFKIQDSTFNIQNSKFNIQHSNSGFKIQDPNSRFKIQDSRLKIQNSRTHKQGPVGWGFGAFGALPLLLANWLRHAAGIAGESGSLRCR
ncbi:MAG: hypothetical protein ACLQVG_25700 [Terriglobia bacterium]